MKSRTAAILAITVFTTGLVACGAGSGRNISVNTNPTPQAATTTRNYALTGFTEVEIRNSFGFIVQQGDHFAIEVTVDSDDIDRVKVSLDGVRAKVEFDPSYTGDIRTSVAGGIITLPSLSAIELSGSAFADVAGFQESFVEMTQSGSSHIIASNNRFDYVSASLDGNSQLMLADVAPIPAAHIESHGSSQATIKLMDGGSLTGAASGSSNISYFGKLVNVQVSTFNTATVTWLGSSGN